jgi:preprotein translocase SecE subunit
MAEKKEDSKNKKPRVLKKTQTVRERAATARAEKPKRIRKTASTLTTPLKKASSKGKKEYHLPLPDNKVGRILSRRVRFVPSFIKNAWNEIRLVTWPNRRDTLRLTMAVFIFAIVFAVIVGLLDYALDKLFKEVLLDIK